jgi:hypothetical protein
VSIRPTEIPALLASEALETSIRLQWPRYGAVRVGYSVVEISALQTVISRVAFKRLELVSSILAGTMAQGLASFLPLIYLDDDGHDRIAFGPLVERAGDRLLLIDGVHRSLAAHHAGLDSIYVAVIEPENALPPPGAVYGLLDSETVHTDAPRLPLFPGRASDHFRPSARFTAEAERGLLTRMTHR